MHVYLHFKSSFLVSFSLGLKIVIVEYLHAIYHAFRGQPFDKIENKDNVSAYFTRNEIQWLPLIRYRSRVCPIIERDVTGSRVATGSGHDTCYGTSVTR